MEYFITKLSFREDVQRIRDVFAYDWDGTTLSDGEDRLRHWMVNRTNGGSDISILTKNEDGQWIRGSKFMYENDCYSWGKNLPKNITKRKTFLSYFHKDDGEYRRKFENLFGDLIINKSVQEGDIETENSHEYIKQLIQKEYLHDTTILVVLIGNKTKCRKHVDWEISGALNYKVGETYAGLLGLILPNHPDYGKDTATHSLMPTRLSDNFKEGYAIIRDWTTDRTTLQSYIELAFANRSAKADKRINSRPQMSENTCE